MRKRRKSWLLLLIVLAIVGLWLFLQLSADEPVDYADIEEHFKYGSIGSEPGGSLLSTHGGNLPPYWVFRALPEICPEKLPEGYASLGLILEEGKDLPIGFAKRRRLGLQNVGLNCAVCHTGTLRETPESEPRIVLGMPAHGLDLQGLFRFVLDCTLDDRVTADSVLGAVEKLGGEMGFVEKMLYRTLAIAQVKLTVLSLQRSIAPLLGDQVPDWGRGRVDTFNPYKALQFGWPLDKLPPDEIIGASDYPSLWNQKPRAEPLPQAPEGMYLHWDGNNNSVDERNLSASLGAGVTPTTIDHDRLQRVRDWIWTLEVQKYPYRIDEELAAQGEALYRDHVDPTSGETCLNCHADHRFREGVVAGTRVGTVVPIEQIDTDPHRLNSYTHAFAANQYNLYPSSQYRFRHFHKTNGYANHPLDGIWARSPYLHNGSVPTLRDLLEPEENRPTRFYRGYDVFDQGKVGFLSDVAAEGKRQYFLYDTKEPGNSNRGHRYGLSLSPDQKDAIVEYMKRF